METLKDQLLDDESALGINALMAIGWFEQRCEELSDEVERMANAGAKTG